MESPADTLLANTILGLTRGLDFDPDAFQTPKNSLALGISLEQALFAQGKVSVGLKIAKTYKRTLNCRYVAQRQKTVADVTNLFNGCLLARENTAIAQEAVSLAQRSHELAITRASLGDGTALDTLNARYNLETAMLSLRKFQERQRSAYAALAQAVGRESEDTPLEIEGELKEQSFDYTLEEAMDTMHANNKKIGELQGTAGVQELLVKLGKTDYLPLVFAGASVTRINMFDDILDEGWFTDEQYDSKVYVGATLTLFDGTKREQKLRQAQADYRIFEQQRAEAIDKLELALRDTYGKYQSNRANVRSARTLRDLAQRGYDVAAEMYEAQALSQLELRQKELDLNNARLALNAALYELQSTIISLQLLMGTLPLSEQGT